MASTEGKLVYSLRSRIVQQSSSPSFDGKSIKRRKYLSIAFEDEDASASKITVPDAGHAPEAKTENTTASRRPKRSVTIPISIVSSNILSGKEKAVLVHLDCFQHCCYVRSSSSNNFFSQPLH